MIRRYLVSYYGKALLALREKLDRSVDPLITKLHVAYLRNEAHHSRRRVVRKKGVRVVSSQVRKTLKEYAKQRFGSESYWPYLALYTEIRGEFIKGWLPYEYYKCVLLPRFNPKLLACLNDQKTFDYRLFGDFAIKPLFLFISGLFMTTDLQVVSGSEVKRYLSDYNNRIVIKEDRGHCGSQVNIIHSSAFNPDDFYKGINYIIQPYIKQYKALDQLYSGSVNTFRVNTFLKSDGSVVVKYFWLRFGADGGKLDNLSTGGNYLFFYSTGNHSNMIYDNDGFEISDRHKNTGYLFSDLKIPMLPDLLEKCIDAHKKYPYVRLIAWDVCIDSTGKPLLIEWNANEPGFLMQESRFGPLWPDDEF